MKTYIIAVSNEKGGVAKTTTVLSLGAALSEMGQKILLIDLDPQANLTLALGYQPKNLEHTIADVLLETAPLLNGRLSTSIPGADLIPSNASMENAEQVLPVYINYTTRLKTAVTACAELPYELVIMDCPPSLGAVTINALTTANLLIIPTQAEYFSAYALRDMMNLIRQVRNEDNPDLAYRILITMLDQRNRAHRNIHEQLDRTFGQGLFKTLIEIDTKLRESPILGMAITQYKPNSRGALQYRNLAEELMFYVKQKDPETA